MLQGMREMGKDVGVSFDQISTALNKIDAARLDAIKDSGSGAAKSFATLGLSSRQLAGMNTEQTITAMADAFVKSGRGAEELSAMVDLLGARGMRMLPVFEALGNDGEAAFDKLAKAGRISADSVINDMDRLGDKMGEAGSRIGNAVSSVLSKFLGDVDFLMAAAGHFVENPSSALNLVGSVGKSGPSGAGFGAKETDRMTPFQLAVRGTEEETKAEAAKKATTSAAIIASQKGLLDSGGSAAKLAQQNQMQALKQSGMSDALLRMGGGMGRDVSTENLTTLHSIDQGIKQLVAKDTAPRMR
jgi:hypothetical protein